MPKAREVTSYTQLGKLQFGYDRSKGIVYLGLGNGKAIDITNGILIGQAITQIRATSTPNPLQSGSGLQIGNLSGVLHASNGTLLGGATTDEVPEGSNLYLTATNLASTIHAATGKTTPVDADEWPMADSAASYGLKLVSWANIKATLKSYFDTVYAALTHASRHISGGADAIKLDDLATPDDNTDLNASTARHGLLKKLSNVSTEFMNGQGNWAAPAGSGGTQIYYGVSSTGNDTYAITPSPALSAYAAGTVVLFEADVANTGASSLNVSGLGAVALKNRDGSDTSVDTIKAGQAVACVYTSGSVFMVLYAL